MPTRRDDIIDTLRQRFLSALHLGLLAPGDKLPSARDIGRELGVDRKVVLAAYRWLEREGVIELRQRSGVFFAPAAAVRAHAGDAWQAAWMVDMLLEGLAHGTPAQALGDALRRHVTTLSLRVACLECNDDQIASLRAELTGNYALAASGVLIDPLRDDTAELAGDGGAESPPALRHADLLVTTPFHASEVKLVAEALGKPWIAVTLRADVLAEIARLLMTESVYAVVADPRFAHKLRLVFGSTAGAANFHALVAGRDDVDQIPEGAAVYVTPLARERLGREALRYGRRLDRATPDGQSLSPASARRLLTFIVRANMAAVAGETAG